jgi:F-type H+-transporting ATPase subunit b
MPQLDISNFFSQAFWLLLLFLLLYSFVKKIMIPGIDKVLSERSGELNLILQEAEKNNQEAKKILEEAVSLKKDSGFNFSSLEETIFNKIKKENEIKLNKISSDLSKEYEYIKSKYENELSLISKEIPKISDEVANILLKKISDTYQ